MFGWPSTNVPSTSKKLMSGVLVPIPNSNLNMFTHRCTQSCSNHVQVLEMLWMAQLVLAETLDVPGQASTVSTRQGADQVCLKDNVFFKEYISVAYL